MYTISPAEADAAGRRCKASTVSSVVIRWRGPIPASLQRTTSWPGRRVPRVIRPIANRPMWLS